MTKTLAEIIPFTEKDKVIIELLDEKIHLLEDELDKIEEENRILRSRKKK